MIKLTKNKTCNTCGKVHAIGTKVVSKGVNLWPTPLGNEVVVWFDCAHGCGSTLVLKVNSVDFTDKDTCFTILHTFFVHEKSDKELEEYYIGAESCEDVRGLFSNTFEHHYATIILDNLPNFTKEVGSLPIITK